MTEHETEISPESAEQILEAAREEARQEARDVYDDEVVEADGEEWSVRSMMDRFEISRRTALGAMGLLIVGSVTDPVEAVMESYAGTAEAQTGPKDFTVPGDMTVGGALSADGAAINRSTATISNGTLPYNNESWIAVAGESSPDDLDYIEPSTINGQLLILNGTADSINVRHNQGGSGEIFLAGATNKTIQYAADSLVLQYRNSISAWAEIAYADAT